MGDCFSDIWGQYSLDVWIQWRGSLVQSSMGIEKHGGTILLPWPWVRWEWFLAAVSLGERAWFLMHSAAVSLGV
eukprot:3145786-Karenia_brevis.AAC.1